MCESRRDFLRATSGAVLGLSACGLSSRAGTGAAIAPRQRMDVSQLTDTSPDILALKKAIGVMKTGLGPSDRRSWEAQAKIHGTFSAGFTSCQHGNWFFLPWHRGYLHFFEEIVRTLSGYADFALPYWDWSTSFQLPSLFWGAGNPLDNPARPGEPDSGRQVVQSSQISARDQARFVNSTVISTLLNQPDFETFAGLRVNAPGQMAGAGELEQTPHNFIHRWVGGDMVTGESPFDPIFWLHHCNVDRLWTEWVRKHPNGMPENDTAWTGTAFTDFCDGMGNPTTIKVAQTLKTTDLGYEYANPAPPTRARPVAAPGRTGLRSVAVSQPAARAEFENGCAVYRYTPPVNQMRDIRSVAENGIDERNTIVRMRMEGIRIPRNQNVVLQVHVNCELASRDLPITDPSYVRSSTFFYPHAMNGHDRSGHDTISFVTNVRPALGKLYADRRLSLDEPLKVVVIAEPLFPDSSRAWTGEVQEVSPQQISFEVVRR
jgi:hypothetical protein